MRRRRRWTRKFVRSEWLHRVMCYAMHLFIRFVYLTNRWTVEGNEHTWRLHAEGRSFIVAFWHGRLMMLPMAWLRPTPFHMLISAHRDGRIIADVVAYSGIRWLAGSTRHGGTAALRSMVKLLAAGDVVGITPDGPAGPAMVASTGIVNVARLARVPIVPIVFATSRRRVLGTWDRMVIGLPFGRAVFIWGEPIEVEHDLDEAGLERVRLLIETRMNEMAEEADRRVGAKPVARRSADRAAEEPR